jgi:hypothetical protein
LLLFVGDLPATICYTATVFSLTAQSVAPSPSSGMKPAGYHAKINNYFIMAQPTKPVALSMEQIGELNQKLSALRHDMNNSLSLIAATVALIRHRPAITEQMWNTLAEQPRKIGESFSQFSRDLEATLHISRP